MYENGGSYRNCGINVNGEILLAKKFETGISKTPLIAQKLVLQCCRLGKLLPRLVVEVSRAKHKKLTWVIHKNPPERSETKSKHLTRTCMWAKNIF